MVRRRRRPTAIPLRPPRVIAYLSAHHPVAVRGDRLAAKMVSHQVIQRAAPRPHCYSDAVGIIILHQSVSGVSDPFGAVPSQRRLGITRIYYLPFSHMSIFED